jgi:hypothetical protein
MVHVTDAEIMAYLDTPYLEPDQLPSAVAELLQPYWDAAARFAAAIEQRRQQTDPELVLRLDRLQRLFSLSVLDVAMLLVCLLPELDGRYRRLFGFLQDDASRTRPSAELVLQILQPLAPEPEEGRAALQAPAPLALHQLLRIEAEAGGEALPARFLRVDDRIVGYLLADDRLDQRLKAVLSEPAPLAWERLILEPELRVRLQSLATWLGRPGAGTLPVFFSHGTYGSGGLEAARALCTALQRPLLLVNMEIALRVPEGWLQLVELVLREARLRGAAVYWSDTQRLRERDQPTLNWDTLVAATERFEGLSFLASETPWDPAGVFYQRPFLRLDFPVPSYEVRKQLWEAYLPAASEFAEPVPPRAPLVATLANAFQLTGGQIADAVATARAEALPRRPESPRLVVNDLYEGCRRQSSRSLVSFARLIEPRLGLDFKRLILPEANRRQVDELRSRIRFRNQVYTGMGFERVVTLGKGLIALFTGSSGTGKTMAAELLGLEYGLQLYKVDLAAVVSKYVGETEKNLSQVFSEAEHTNAILLFDEGEALFGKRGEIKEARDRWANTEVNYLLQRVEEYAGVVILTTNFRQNMDPAFLRRIHVIVDFPRPEAEARFRIWKGMFPEGMVRPTDEKLHTLAQQFSLSGGNINNVVIDAAFRALAEAKSDGPVITVRHLVLGIGREYQKLGQALTRGDFGVEYYAWVEEEIL